MAVGRQARTKLRVERLWWRQAVLALCVQLGSALRCLRAHHFEGAGRLQSACVLKAITDAKLDAVVGYTQRFRRKWLAGKEKVRSGALG
jgi:hypothetical protein